MRHNREINPHDCVPWTFLSDFAQVVMSFEAVETRNEGNCGRLRETACLIRKEYTSLAGPMDEICGAACPECRDICCRRATVWFDFQDLLYLYFGTCDFPESQIRPKYDSDSGKSCCFFSENGCTLKRHARPFVCTWYVCPSQKHYITSCHTDLEEIIFSGLATIKKLKNELESEFLNIIIAGLRPGPMQAS